MSRKASVLLSRLTRKSQHDPRKERRGHTFACNDHDLAETLPLLEERRDAA